jgi:Trk-type K+ transport system membrane component
MAKKLEHGSIYNELDVDGDGIITDDEMRRAKEIEELEYTRIRHENEDAKEDQIRKMAWFALFGILLYPLAIIICALTGQDKAGELLADIAPTYFVAAAGLVAAFFGAQAYSKSKSNESK